MVESVIESGMGFAVLGHPIAHSLSPTIHQAFAEQFELKFSYERIDVAPEAFGDFWTAGRGRQLTGANITFPLKELACQAADALGQHAREAEAVNTLVWRDGRLYGFNTDGVGLLTDLMQNLALPINGKRLLLLGAGGAVRGVLGPLLREAPAELVLANRTISKAQDLADRFACDTPLQVCGLETLPDLDSFDGVINATTSGYGGRSIDLPTTLLHEHSWCYDLSYASAAEPFLNWAQRAGAARYHDGLGMLVEQAAESFRHWHGLSPRTDSVIQRLA